MQPPENDTEASPSNGAMNLVGAIVALICGYLVSLTQLGKVISNALGQDLGKADADRWEIRFIGFVVGMLLGGTTTLILWGYWEKRKQRRAAAESPDCQETAMTPSDRALRAAIRQCDLDQVEALLAEGVDLATRDAKGRTPLMIAAEVQSTEVVKYLLQAGADPRPKDSLGHTAEDIAYWHGEVHMSSYTAASLAIVEMLRDRRCDS